MKYTVAMAVDPHRKVNCTRKGDLAWENGYMKQAKEDDGNGSKIRAMVPLDTFPIRATKGLST